MCALIKAGAYRNFIKLQKKNLNICSGVGKKFLE